MNIDERIYLEHWGVQGMKWGVRKERRANETPQQKRWRATKKRARKETAKNAVKLSVAVAAYGAAYVLARRLSYRTVSLSGFGSRSMTSRPSMGNVGPPWSSVKKSRPMPPPAWPMPPAPASPQENLKAEYARKIGAQRTKKLLHNIGAHVVD